MKRLQTIFLCLTLAVAAFADINVKGTVIDADNQEPLIGVSVLVMGTTTGTVTDFDGKFELAVPDKATLQLSYIGYKTIELRAIPEMQIIMESDAQQLQEVVSLGYSAVKKAELSSAVVTVSADALTDVTSSDVGNMLQGKIAGVQISNSTGQPGAQAEIRIRGTGSITAAADPCYVVDGVMGGSFNPNDVESISVLKDAGATGIYGAAAAGGVIVVTTKSGKRNDKARVTIRTTVGSTQPLFGNRVMMKSEELYEYQRQIFYDKGMKAQFPKQRPAELLDRDYDWQNCFFKNGMTQDYYISVAGGGQKLGYYASFNYYKQDGTFINTGYERFTGRVNLNAEITKWLDMKVNAYFDKSSTESEASWRMMNDAYTKMPWDNPYDETITDKNVPIYIESAVRSDNGKDWYSQDRFNGLHNAAYDYSRGGGLSMGTDAQLNFHITDWLTLQSTNRFTHSTDKWTVYEDPRTFHPEVPDGYLENSHGQNVSFGTTDILKASYQWGNHSVNGMIGGEYGYWKNEYTNAGATGMPRGFKFDALNVAPNPYTAGGYMVNGWGAALFAQAGYDYAKRYFVNATFRAEWDAASFANKTKVGYFPSISASWLISNEEFMKDQKAVTFLKLRASYGITGNNGIAPYQFRGTFSLSDSYQSKVAAIAARQQNDSLHWESARMASVGVDLILIDRIDMSIDLYNTDNVDLLLDRPTPPSTGYTSSTQNIGKVRNQGIEYRLDAMAVKTKDIRWNIGFNIGFNRNRVTYMPDHTAMLPNASGVYQQIKEGQDIYTWFMKEWAGVDPENGDPLWYTIDAEGNKTTTNNYNKATETTVGKATPLFQGGLNTQFSWKGLALSVNTNFTVGNKVYNYNRQVLDCDGAYMGYAQYSIEHSKLGWSRWQEPGDIATHPKAVMNGNKNSNQVSSRYLEDGSFFRLKNITLSYDFCATLIPKKYMSKCRVFVSADNIATATKFSGMDPEVSLSNSVNSLAGFCADQYPVARNIVGGIEIEF